MTHSSYELFRSEIADAAGADRARVAVHSVHQHTAPYTDGDAQRLLDEFDDLTDRQADSVRKSVEPSQPFDQVGTPARPRPRSTASP